MDDNNLLNEENTLSLIEREVNYSHPEFNKQRLNKH